MAEDIIDYFEECIRDFQHDIEVNKHQNELLNDDTEYISRYNKYIGIIKTITECNDSNRIKLIDEIITDFQERIDIKNQRIESGIFNDELLLEYINSNKQRYQIFIDTLKKLKSL